MDGLGTRQSSPWQSKTFGTSLSLHLDRPVNAMSISPSGRDVVLASRAGLYIVDLDDPYLPPRFIRHTTPWEVADVQWSPHAAKSSWVISTSNQKAMVWNLALPSTAAIERVLHAHTRAITDINFHSFDPELLATCAVDAFVHVWDMRAPAKPIQSFCDWRASATQVKWNRQNPHVVASSHDRFVRIWDDRFGARPLRSINAHSTKIYGVDFNRLKETQLITCSLDKTVKYWDYSNQKDEPVRVVNTDFPVWKARHTPFGDGCVIMPQRGGKNAVFIISNKPTNPHSGVPDQMNPVEELVGHTEPIKEFLWRTRGGETGVDSREFQLVTWSKDRDLRLWQISDRAFDGVGHVKNQPLRFRMTRLGTPYVSFNHEPETFAVPEAMPGTPGTSASLSPLQIRQSSSSAASAAAARSGSIARSPSQSHHHHIHHYGHRPSTSAPKFNNPQSRFMTRGGKGQDKISHLNWLSGVRIGRAAFARPADEDGSATAGVSSNASLADGSAGIGDQGAPGQAVGAGMGAGSPENFGEEVSIVGHKFPKIVFEKIEVAKGEIVVTLNGPWGPEGALVFIRLQAWFPSDYPKKQEEGEEQEAEQPRLEIEPNKDIAEEDLKSLESQVQEIATKLSGRGMFCLEPCLRYMMGEKSVLDDLDRIGGDLFDVPELLARDDDDESSSDDEIVMSPPK
ncbi:WD40-repeat-containing domain protein [Myxozyma melibiosi]|uniref:WD40-repeat-containing domain protein n=1 Tax=Myxozyma melibiosi TaxID=54550 RepID=A0ABR1F838_9ASCO